MAITSSLLTRLASVSTPGVYAAVIRQALPPLCAAIAASDPQGQEKWLAGAALEQLCGVLQGAPVEGGVGEGFVAQLGPVLFSRIRGIADRDAIQVYVPMTSEYIETYSYLPNSTPSLLSPCSSARTLRRSWRGRTRRERPA